MGVGSLPTRLPPDSTWLCPRALSPGHLEWQKPAQREDSLVTSCGSFYSLKWAQWKRLGKIDNCCRAIYSSGTRGMVATTCFTAWLLGLGSKCSSTHVWEESLQWPDGGSGKTQGLPALPPALPPAHQTSWGGKLLHETRVRRRFCIIPSSHQLSHQSPNPLPPCHSEDELDSTREHMETKRQP